MSGISCPHGTPVGKVCVECVAARTPAADPAARITALRRALEEVSRASPSAIRDYARGVLLADDKAAAA